MMMGPKRKVLGGLNKHKREGAASKTSYLDINIGNGNEAVETVPLSNSSQNNDESRPNSKTQ